MPEKESTSNTHNTSSNVDLNSLADLSFGPSWADDTNARKSNRKDSSQNKKFGGSHDSRNIKKDRRGQTKFKNNRSDASFSKKKSLLRIIKGANSYLGLILKFTHKMKPLRL